MKNDIKHTPLSWDSYETSGGQVVTLYDNKEKRIIELPAAQTPLIAHIVKCVNSAEYQQNKINGLCSDKEALLIAIYYVLREEGKSISAETDKILRGTIKQVEAY